MFIDEVKLKVIAGMGGNGLVSWRREKCVPNGGPRGGNGGNGGNVYIQTNNNLNTLGDYRHKKVLKAGDGVKGGTELMQGGTGEDLILYVPVGTIVKNVNNGEIIVDLTENNLKYLIVRGGRGGYGNAHFTSPTRQAPKFAELGDVGEELDISLELKLVADIGIIGIPSAGKSTLIGTITNVKPKIGDYPFTTLTPNLGVLEHKGKTLVLEDVPGLIPGASEGKGLGIQFLKHIERTKVILHLLDMYRLDQVFKDYEDIRNELTTFSPELGNKEEIIVFSKADLLDNEMKDFIVNEFRNKFKKDKIIMISSASHEGIEELKDFLIDNYSTNILENDEIKFVNPEYIRIIDLKNDDNPKNIELEYIGDYIFTASGKRLEQIVRMTDFTNLEAVMRVYDVMEKLGVIKKIESKLNKIMEEENIDNDFFFEGGRDNNFHPKVLIANKEIPLEKLKYNL
ncbi:MAG: GTPase ObgE [Candidatus Gracilibacteria bacterium]|nr:GTPase ObgE [Candidatus Gracilibacteria bacterium]